MRRWLYLGDAGPYPASLRALFGRDVSGAYAIRDRESGEVLYVGESHSGRLYHTLTRHMQRWRRSSSSGRGMTGANDPGTTYRREDVEVRWSVVSASSAMALETRWIRLLDPRDNVEAGADGRQVTTRKRRQAESTDLPPPF